MSSRTIRILFALQLFLTSILVGNSTVPLPYPCLLAGEFIAFACIGYLVTQGKPPPGLSSIRIQAGPFRSLDFTPPEEKPRNVCPERLLFKLGFVYVALGYLSATMTRELALVVSYGLLSLFTIGAHLFYDRDMLGKVVALTVVAATVLTLCFGKSLSSLCFFGLIVLVGENLS